MPSGLQISTQFAREIVLPLLRRELPQDFSRLAVAVVGTGSDVLGLDDEISRDHHWGPRATIFCLRADAARLQPALKSILAEKTPRQYQQYAVQVGLDHLIGVCSTTVEEFFGEFLGTEELPQTELDWLKLCEVDLLHVTAGEIVYDGAGEFTRRRQHLAYFPDNVWKKRLADWCMYVTGRDAPYNLNRVARRGDKLTGGIYLNLCLKRQMELLFALNRRYAPYTKWLNASFRRLPRYAAAVAPLIDQVVQETDAHQQVLTLIEINFHIAQALAELGLTAPPHRREFDPGLSDLTLYDSAAQIYRTIPRELFDPSFNQIEYWERLARGVLFDTNDFFKSYVART